MPRYHVVVTVKDQTQLGDLVRQYRVTVARHTVERLAAGRFRIHAHATSAQIRALEAAGYRVRKLENAEQEGRVRQREYRRALVSRQRALAGALPAAKAVDHYLSVDEVEAELAAMTAAATDVTELISLPHQTWEGRTCHAVRIGKGGGSGRPAIYLLGGVHAREWGSPDILMKFMHELVTAYGAGTGVTIGPKKFSAAVIKSIVEEKDVVVFPQANPDGRAHSMTTEPMWRKNRRPGQPGHSECLGVDLNRNYDFLWDFPKYFDPQSPIANSTDPCDPEVYIGPAPFSEPESKNAAWLFENFPHVRYFIDVHSYSETILYNWGDDEPQAADPAMNFQNPSYDGKRGMMGDGAYREYLDPSDKTAILKLARAMQSAIAAVRGRHYKVQPAVGLYPTAGTSDDYAFSRHLIDAAKAKVYGFTIEWGRSGNPTPFHPPYPEMSRIIQEVTAGIFGFCARAS